MNVFTGGIFALYDIVGVFLSSSCLETVSTRIPSQSVWPFYLSVARWQQRRWKHIKSAAQLQLVDPLRECLFTGAEQLVFPTFVFPFSTTTRPPPPLNPHTEQYTPPFLSALHLDALCWTSRLGPPDKPQWWIQGVTIQSLAHPLRHAGRFMWRLCARVRRERTRTCSPPGRERLVLRAGPVCEVSLRFDWGAVTGGGELWVGVENLREGGRGEAQLRETDGGRRSSEIKEDSLRVKLVETAATSDLWSSGLS